MTYSIIISILIYLGALIAGNTYTTQQYQQVEAQYQSQVQQVQNDPQQMIIVQSQYSGSGIIIQEEEGGGTGN